MLGEIGSVRGIDRIPLSWFKSHQGMEHTNRSDWEFDQTIRKHKVLFALSFIRLRKPGIKI